MDNQTAGPEDARVLWYSRPIAALRAWALCLWALGRVILTHHQLELKRPPRFLATGRLGALASPALG